MKIDSFALLLASRGFDMRQHVPMHTITTLKIGGPADIVVQPRSAAELRELMALAQREEIPTLFIGNASNLLVRDGGIRGLVVRFGANMAQTRVEGETVYAACGITLAKLAAVAAERELTGFEFASGIPGTLGGAIVMNAGAYKGEMKDVVVSATAMLPDGTTRVFTGDELDFSYRHSCFTGGNMLALDAVLRLRRGKGEDIRALMQDLSRRRHTTQPLEYPSAGSAFKRPKDGFAAAMIDQAGLKGFTVGGAQISEKHAGFIVNRGGATARNVEDLLAAVQKTVFDRFGTMLEPEIVIVGEKA